MTNPIVQVNVSALNAPKPSALQRSGAFISQGATNTSPGTYSLLTQPADLTPLLNGALGITGITQSAGLATAVTAANHNLPIGDPIEVTIAGSMIAGYNGTFLATPTTATHFTYAVASGTTSPATGTIVYTLEDVAELVAMMTTFFAQGSQTAVWVLELGADDVAGGVAFLTAWIAANPGVFYSYLVPRVWDANAAFLTMLGNFNAKTAKTYFQVTSTLATWKNYTAQMKCALVMIECPNYGIWPANVLTALSQTGGAATATTTTNHGVLPGQYFTLAGNTPSGWNGTYLALPGTATNSLLFTVPSSLGAESVLGTLVQSQYASAGIPATEFSLAAVFWVTLSYNPKPTNKVTVLNQSFLTGVTPFPTQGNAALLATLNAGNINIVGTGFQGGISDTILIGGNMMDGNPFNYWYSVDWVQINAQLNCNAALINAANNPQSPIYYDQPGINSLLQVIVSTMNTGIGSGLVLNPVKATTLDASDFAAALDADTYSGFTVVNADPFASYVDENPNDYEAGIYNGYSIEYVPLRGFQSITINITVSNFAS